MDIRQLHYFREIVRQGSISKAAEVLHIAQPPLSQMLIKLENNLGTTLIHRYRKKWELTETGTLLYQFAEQMLTQVIEVKQRIQEIEQGLAGTISIGVSSACSNILIDYVSLFRTQYPKVKIKLITGNSEELLKKLERREIDVVSLLRPDNSEQYQVKILNKQPFVLIIPTSWLSSFSSQDMTLEQIASLPFIMLGAMEGHFLYESIMETFNKHDLQPNIIMECKDLTMVVALVSKGIGLSIIPKMDYASPSAENITLIEIKQFDFCVEPVFLKLKEESISKAAIQFWEIVDVD